MTSQPASTGPVGIRTRERMGGSCQVLCNGQLEKYYTYDAQRSKILYFHPGCCTVCHMFNRDIVCSRQIVI